MNKIFLCLRNTSVAMIVAGVVLPFLDIKFPIFIWNILQIGGFAGLVIFGLAHHFTRGKKG